LGDAEDASSPKFLFVIDIETYCERLGTRAWSLSQAVLELYAAESVLSGQVQIGIEDEITDKKGLQ
jgi:hypothetical protein